MKCLNASCSNEITSKDERTKFCSRSCAASHNNSVSPKRRKTSLVGDLCLNCCHMFWYYPSRNDGKYCSNQCSAEHSLKKKWRRIEKGEHVDAKTMRKFLAHKFGEKCSECGQGITWNDKPLVLQVDHIDGDSDNGHWTNCRLLCPNCHTQTPTFGSKGRGSRYRKSTRRNEYLRKIKGY